MCGLQAPIQALLLGLAYNFKDLSYIEYAYSFSIMSITQNLLTYSACISYTTVIHHIISYKLKQEKLSQEIVLFCNILWTLIGPICYRELVLGKSRILGA